MKSASCIANVSKYVFAYNKGSSDIYYNKPHNNPFEKDTEQFEGYNDGYNDNKPMISSPPTKKK